MSIKSDWDEYAERVLPSIGESNRRIFRDTYYAGVFTMLEALAAISKEDVTPEQGQQILEDLAQEGADFLEAKRLAATKDATG